jgi:hypothetical protein
MTITQKNFIDNLNRASGWFNEILSYKPSRHFVFDERNNQVVLEHNIDSIYLTFNTDDDFNFIINFDMYRIECLMVTFGDTVSKTKIMKFISDDIDSIDRYEIIGTKIDERFDDVDFKGKLKSIITCDILKSNILVNQINKIYFENSKFEISELEKNKCKFNDCIFGDEFSIIVNQKSELKIEYENCNLKNLTMKIDDFDTIGYEHYIKFSNCDIGKLEIKSKIKFSDIAFEKCNIENLILDSITEIRKSEESDIKCDKYPILNKISEINHKMQFPKSILFFNGKIYTSVKGKLRNNFQYYGECDTPKYNKEIYIFDKNSDILDDDKTLNEFDFICEMSKDNIVNSEFNNNRTYFLFDFINDLFIQTNRDVIEDFYYGNTHFIHDDILDSDISVGEMITLFSEINGLKNNLIVKKIINKTNKSNETIVELKVFTEPLHSAYTITYTQQGNLIIVPSFSSTNTITVLR